MTRYLENFFQGGDQIISLAAVFAVWIALSVIGGAIGGRERVRQIDHLIGWSVVSLILTGGGVLTRIPFTYLTIGAGVLALVSGSVLWRRGDGIGSVSWARLLILGLPFFALLSAMRGSQWDEFTDWLVIPRYLLETDAFPSHDNPYANANLLAYPYSWHFITYMASRLSGQFLENAGAISNVLLLFGFGLLTLRLIIRGLGREDLARTPTWGLVALAGLSATLFNPTFAQKVALTAYADTSSAVVTGTAVILGWFMVEALAEGDPRLARRYAWCGADYDDLVSEGFLGVAIAADRFDPERFAADRREDKSHRYAWEPFGGGVHKCLGMGFAGLEIKAVLAAVLAVRSRRGPGRGFSPKTRLTSFERTQRFLYQTGLPPSIRMPWTMPSPTNQ